MGSCVAGRFDGTGADLTVLKFGSSVLSCPEGYGVAAGEVEREVGRGRRVLAVVSAMAETTDRLLEVVRALSDRPARALVAQLLGTGEDASVALMGIALTARGVNASVCPADGLALRTRGPLDDAEPLSFDQERLAQSLRTHEAVVVPGFVGWDASGAPALLGRGGSDLTALYLAHALGAVEVRLVKDVDGVFPADPRQAPPEQRALETASVEVVEELGNGVVQGKALRFAAAAGLSFRVAAPGGSGTLVGAGGRV